MPIRSSSSVVTITVVILAALLPNVATAETSSSEAQTDRVLVKKSDGSWDTRILREPNQDIQALKENEPDIVEVSRPRRYVQFEEPNDPAYSLQWHLKRNQTARAAQHADGTGVVVAVLDSGLDIVSDLICRPLTAPADFVHGDSGVPSDLTGHGTLVTQVLGECTNNSLLGAGTAPGVTVMPIRVIDESGATSTVEVFDGLLWALDHGADVVNLSLGFHCSVSYPSCGDPAIDFAIDQLTRREVLVVAASGNDGGNHIAYPANHPETVAVGATGYDRRRATYSTGGSGLQLVAPTGDELDPPDRDGVIHQGSSGSLEIASGTSFSAPQASGALAMLLSAGATPDGALTALLSTAQDLAPTGYDIGTGHGEIRIREALAWGGNGLTPPISDALLHFVGDTNGDGKADVITYDGQFGRWWVLTSSGSAFEAKEWTRYSTVSGWSAHKSGDFDGDGRLDLASFHPSNGTWWISRSTGNRFTTTLWADFSTSSGWGPQLVGDFDGDGRDDIANYHASNGTWWVSKSTGSRLVTGLWADFDTASGWKTHLVGDFNGDGRDDLASYHPSNGTWWVSRSDGTRFTTELWADFSTSSGWARHLIGDFDGDGRDDIANFHPSNGTWWISRSTGARFSTALWADFSTPSGWSPQLVGDFNGDGRADIGNYAASNGTWWVSRSTGAKFTTSLWADYSTATGYTAQIVGDFDADGRDDIANHHRRGVWVVSRSTGVRFATTTWYE